MFRWRVLLVMELPTHGSHGRAGGGVFAMPNQRRAERKRSTCFSASWARWSASVTLCSRSCICKTQRSVKDRNQNQQGGLEQPPSTTTGPTLGECPGTLLSLIVHACLRRLVRAHAQPGRALVWLTESLEFLPSSLFPSPCVFLSACCHPQKGPPGSQKPPLTPQPTSPC